MVNKSKILELTQTMSSSKGVKFIHPIMSDLLHVEAVSTAESNIPHKTVFIRGFLYNGKPCCIGVNLTSNIDINPNLICLGTAASKSTQN